MNNSAIKQMHASISKLYALLESILIEADNYKAESDFRTESYLAAYNEMLRTQKTLQRSLASNSSYINLLEQTLRILQNEKVRMEDIHRRKTEMDVVRNRDAFQHEQAVYSKIEGKKK